MIWFLICRMRSVENTKAFLFSSMKKWEVMFCADNLELIEDDFRRGIFPGSSLYLLVFVLGLIPLSLVLRSFEVVCKFSQSKGKINHLLFMADLKL